MGGWGLGEGKINTYLVSVSEGEQRVRNPKPYLRVSTLMARNPGGIGEAPAWGDDGAAEGVLVDFLFDFAVFALCGQEQLPICPAAIVGSVQLEGLSGPKVRVGRAPLHHK